MLAVGEGDIEAFEELVRRHQIWAWGIAYRFLGHREEAEDMVQDAFLRLLEASGRYQPTSALKTYFYQIITRLCLDRAKKRQLRYLDIMPDVPASTPDAPDQMEKTQEADAVRAALDALAPQQRMAVVLRYYEGLSYQDIASALEITPKAVERLLARGRDRLQTILKTWEDF
ncbi:MAG: RNA polymerase subunit sigma-70 [Planctomycetes bacterium RBG_13_62_9]|nr:MAG: RNA polymerase subunit sigma-70 [Planctomycetes bacterium RBG_13_62_9]